MSERDKCVNRDTGIPCEDLFMYTTFKQKTCDMWAPCDEMASGTQLSPGNDPVACTTPTPTECLDSDGDGLTTCDGDCNDYDPSIYPDAPCSDLWCGDANCNGEQDCLENSVCTASPIVIDIAGNGFNLTNGTNGVQFDLNSNGIKEHLPWTIANSDDAWLSLDRNGNGKIDDGTELFGNFTPQPQPATGIKLNGFNALAEYDKPPNGGNGDSRINSQDAIFSTLQLWQDKNHNGISEGSELFALAALNIAEFELDYKESKRTDEHGNEFKYRAKVLDAQGSKVGQWAWDVFLKRTR